MIRLLGDETQQMSITHGSRSQNPRNLSDPVAVATPVAPVAAVVLPPTAVSFLVVAGLPLVLRTVLSAHRIGLRPIVVLGGDEAGRLRRLLDRDSRTRGIAIVTDDAAPHINTERVVLLPSDHLVTPAVLGQIAFPQPVAHPSVSLGEASSSPGGVIVTDRSIVPLLQDVVRGAVDASSLPGAAVAPRNGAVTFHVIDATSVPAAEDRVVADIRAASAASDGPMARIDRTLSTRISRWLVRTPLRPNHITIIGTTLGMLAAWSFAQPGYRFGLLGAVLFWMAVIVDGCDGEVARLTFRESRFGHLFDITTDNLVHVAIFIGIGVGAYRAAPDARYVLLGLLLVTGFLCASAATYVCLLRTPAAARSAPQSRQGTVRQRLLDGFEVLMNRDFAYVLLLLALVGRLEWFLWGAAFGTYAFAVGLFAAYRWRGGEE